MFAAISVSSPKNCPIFCPKISLCVAQVSPFSTTVCGVTTLGTPLIWTVVFSSFATPYSSDFFDFSTDKTTPNLAN
ncbi:hypothetical protein ES332_D04G189900v1 [Gossypium tomentosum]|uniref:Uncharacterized protein n=1 Tax=Gossypium tomentosum TaxID=34277 RepID=A0A5D2LGB3_GOSTO|nr:hypothetical protein ES332_D04G189900v1 [Gossypium tomentosum]